MLSEHQAQVPSCQLEALLSLIGLKLSVSKIRIHYCFSNQLFFISQSQVWYRSSLYDVYAMLRSVPQQAPGCIRHYIHIFLTSTTWPKSLHLFELMHQRECSFPLCLLQSSVSI